MAKKQPLSLSLLGTRLFLNRGCVVGVTGRHQKSRRRYAGSQVLRAKQRCFINKGERPLSAKRGAPRFDERETLNLDVRTV